RGMDGSYLARQIGGLLVEHPEVRAYVYDLLKHGPISPGLALLADAVAEDPDTEGLLLLVGFRGTHISMHTIEQVVTAQIPDEDWKGSYNIVPISAVELRRKLLAMTTDGGPADAAARCLNEIDKIRDRYGAPESEPRHPDLASGKKWPTMTPDPDAH
ncbi:MAG: hypothetical protein ISP49_17340, partial [Reyranella sp.]|nr:hypothetical protein [Reyranella sp.]